MKTCSKCGKNKFVTKFTKDVSKRDKLHSSCRECASEWNRQYYQRNKNKIDARNRLYYKANKESINTGCRNWYLKHHHNITIDEYDVMFEQQDGVCAICGLPQLMKRLSIDHNHQTGYTRGLLCVKCNSFIGLACDDIELLRVAIEYLEKEYACK